MRIKETSDLQVLKKKKKKKLVGLNIQVTSCVVILDLFNNLLKNMNKISVFSNRN